MGYKKVPTIYTLDEIPGEEGLIVRIKSIKFGEVRKLMRLTDDQSDESLDQMFKMLTNSIVSWNLEDENDQPVPVSIESLEDQDMEFVMRIIECWMDRMTAPGLDLGKDSQSGAKFPGRPVTMEAL